MMLQAIRSSLSRKYMLAVLATTCTALFVAAATMLALDIRNYQSTWVDDLSAQADILANVSLPALEFNDPEVARENLAQLKVRPRIQAAALYAADGTLFATYAPPGDAAPVFPPQPSASGHLIRENRLEVFKRILRDGELVGTVYIATEYPLQAQIQRYLKVLAVVIAGSLAVALLVSLWLQAAITRPILGLTRAVNQVIGRRDFSQRVRKTTVDEIGILVDAFNGMLAEVGERSAALEESNRALQHEMQERRGAEEALRLLNNTLEERIEERTAELEKAHAQLRQSQKLEAIGQLTGGVAHDFNNVLQVISGNLQLLQADLNDDPDARQRVQTAAFAADRGAKLAAQLLAFARRQPLQPVATDLRRVLLDMDSLLRRALGESIQLETLATEGLWTTLVDPHQLETVILNLALNARDAMQGHGRLTLELINAVLDQHSVAATPGFSPGFGPDFTADIVPGEYVLLAISDTGSGMEPEVLARAFEPFFTTKPEGQGTGLGLSMVYGFVKQSNGHITIYSEPGHGTTVKIYLPRSTQPEVAVNKPRDLAPVGGTETILVVEDDIAVQTTVVDMLTGLGYRVLRANDGQSALDLLREATPVDLLFTDVVMPGPLHSVELARLAKQQRPDLAVLFTSGYTQKAFVRDGRLDPSVELLSKPYRREDLARKLRQLLDGKKERRIERSAAAPIDTDATLPTSDRSARVAAAPFTAPGTPRAIAGSGALGAPEASAAATDGLRILLVEDDADARSVLAELLTLLGHRVTAAASAEAALDTFTQSAFDLLLTDLTLPGMSGLELAREASARDRQLRIIFCSGYGALPQGEFPQPYGVLPKPFRLETLKAALDEAVTSLRTPQPNP